jgi:hypothetical protein
MSAYNNATGGALVGSRRKGEADVCAQMGLTPLDAEPDPSGPAGAYRNDEDDDAMRWLADLDENGINGVGGMRFHRAHQQDDPRLQDGNPLKSAPYEYDEPWHKLGTDDLPDFAALQEKAEALGSVRQDGESDADPWSGPDQKPWGEQEDDLDEHWKRRREYTDDLYKRLVEARQAKGFRDLSNAPLDQREEENIFSLEQEYSRAEDEDAKWLSKALGDDMQECAVPGSPVFHSEMCRWARNRGMVRVRI